MTQLYKRKWRLVAGTDNEQSIEVTALRVTFKVKRVHRAEANGSQISIYNLNKTSRARLSEALEKGLTATLEAGFENAFPLIFQGRIARVVHEHPGSEWISTLESDDGSAQLARSRITQAFKKGTKVSDVFATVANKLGVGIGNALEQFKEGNFERGITEFAGGMVLNGTGKAVLDQLTQTAGLEYSIQDEQIVVTRKGEPLAGQAALLSPETGLVGTPEPGEKGRLRAKALIRPGLNPPRRVELRTKRVSGFYRIDSTLYGGDTHGNDWYATLDLRRLAT